MPPSVLQIEETDRTSWNKDISNYQLSVFMSSAWLESVRQEDLHPAYFLLKEQSRIVAKMAGLQAGVPGRVGHKLYFYAGPALQVHANSTCLESCYQVMAQYARKKGYNRMVAFSYDFPYRMEETPGFHQHHRKEYIVDLRGEEEEVSKKVHRQIRRLSNRAGRSGMELSESRDPLMVDHMFRLMEETRKRRLEKGYPDYSLRHMLYGTIPAMKSMLERKAAVTHMARCGDEIHGIRLLILWEKRAYAYYIGHSKESYDLGVAHFLNYKSMCLLRKQGYQFLNLGGIPAGAANKGIEEYKIHLGGEAFRTQNVSTSFMRFPYTMLSPAVNIAKKMPSSRITDRISDIW